MIHLVDIKSVSRWLHGAKTKNAETGRRGDAGKLGGILNYTEKAEAQSTQRAGQIALLLSQNPIKV